MELEEMSFTALATPRAGDKPAAAPFANGAQPGAPPPDVVPEGLHAQPWLQGILAAEGTRVVFDSRGKDPDASKLSVDLSADHLFLSLLDHHLIKDMVVAYNASSRQLHNALRFGIDVCGHPNIVHGGLTSAILDETFGALLYSMRREGQAQFARVFTARLEVDYTAPLPAQSTVVCTARVESLSGRKLWLAAEVACPTSGVVYARSKSLFVIPRDDPGAAAAGGAAASDSAAAAGGAAAAAASGRAAS
ncbi:MAG: HotDog domain-containing protein [Monoraphidium minutum]|nr:MAG: HotDog domain-containing protein [Monoraphidium minutum]